MSLLWVIIFAVLATIVLQEMAGRLGVVTGNGLAEAIESSVESSPLRWLCLALILAAILVGNAAYQTGNILGAVTGVQILMPNPPTEESALQVFRFRWVWAIGILALIFVWRGRLKFLQQGMMVLVGLMSALFVASAIGSQPSAGDLAQGLVPGQPASWLLVVGLIGTTVVPYNLFLHASAAAERWKSDVESPHVTESYLRHSFWDTVISVCIGGLITAAIMITGAAITSIDQPDSVYQIATILKPTIGAWAQVVFGIGLLAAGLTSAITAPIAAGYVAAGCFGWEAKLNDIRLKCVASLVIAIGMYCAIRFGKSPVQTIIVAQVANGILLPMVAVFLVILMNRKRIMGVFANGPVSNVLGGAVIILTGLLAYRMLSIAWSTIQKLIQSSGV